MLREWLDTRGDKFRRLVEMVTMGVFAGWKQAVESVPPNAVEAGEPFPIMQLAAARVTKVRCRRQARRQGDRLYDCRRTLLTGDEYLGQRGRARLMALFAIEANRAPMLAHDACQRVVGAYRCKDRRRGERMMRELIGDLTRSECYKGCRELASVGRVFQRRMHDILTLFRHSHSSNGPTEAINGRIEILRGNAMSFANITHHIQRSLIHTSQLKDILIYSTVEERPAKMNATSRCSRMRCCTLVANARNSSISEACTSSRVMSRPRFFFANVSKRAVAAGCSIDRSPVKVTSPKSTPILTSVPGIDADPEGSFAFCMPKRYFLATSRSLIHPSAPRPVIKRILKIFKLFLSANEQWRIGTSSGCKRCRHTRTPALLLNHVHHLNPSQLK